MEVLLIDDQAVSVQVYAAIVRKTFSGARGYVPKTTALATLAGAMQTVVGGGVHVPPESR